MKNKKKVDFWNYRLMHQIFLSFTFSMLRDEASSKKRGRCDLEDSSLQKGGSEWEN
jgi:hypothetical protein